MLRFRSLASGSSGNATLVEARAGRQTTRLLIDCGLGRCALDVVLQAAGVAIAELDAIFITHEHGDHTGCVKSLVRHHPVPVWMSEGTWRGMGCPDLGILRRTARAGEDFELGAMMCRPFAVPHDTLEPLQIRCSDGQAHLGVVTDLGHVPGAVLAALEGCTALLLESNHDTDLLQRSPYPPFLKRRVGGDRGHLSNAQAATALATLNHKSLGVVVAAHLSERNNEPRLAQAGLGPACGRTPEEIVVAAARRGTDWLPAG